MGNGSLLRLKAWISRSIAHAPRGGANGAKAGTTRLKRQRIGPVSGGDPHQLVILLHGRGADGGSAYRVDLDTASDCAVFVMLPANRCRRSRTTTRVH